ncbi:MAG: glycosyltransferase [Lachnospiraceae bacterium]|nr:glycosyltransferase [Lachnospiraceae bacterium]
MRTPMFSILMVSLNPGGKLVETMKSVAAQSCSDYEVVVKDGGSGDGSLEMLEAYLEGEGRGCRERVRILRQPDKGIYEGMNQAARAARGEYLYFLNCGDAFMTEQALARAAEEIRRNVEGEARAGRGFGTRANEADGTQGRAHGGDPGQGTCSRIFYGDIYDALRGQVVASNPHMDAFACYRNVPCHQACIYHHSLFAERGYEPGYRVRADYEHFLWCYFRRDARPRYIPVTLASYEGGGFSETPENRKRSAREHREITALYMGKGQRLRYRLILLITLSPLRTRMAESPAWSGLYNKCKKLLYRKTA